jgi:hypothetical protein
LYAALRFELARNTCYAFLLSGCLLLCARWFAVAVIHKLCVMDGTMLHALQRETALCDMRASTKQWQAGAFTFTGKRVRGTRPAYFCGPACCVLCMATACLLSQLSQLCVLWFACCMRCRTCAAGIGFKATAVASEATYIASSGYEFCFDLRPGAYSVPWLGLVCPRWEGGLTQRMQGWAARRAQGGAQGLAP